MLMDLYLHLLGVQEFFVFYRDDRYHRDHRDHGDRRLDRRQKTETESKSKEVSSGG